MNIPFAQQNNNPPNIILSDHIPSHHQNLIINNKIKHPTTHNSQPTIYLLSTSPISTLQQQHMLFKLLIISLFLTIFLLLPYFNLDYSSTIVIHNRSSIELLPAWPAFPKQGQWKKQPVLLSAGENDTIVVDDKIGIHGSMANVTYVTPKKEDILKIDLYTGFLKPNQGAVDGANKVRVQWEMECGGVRKKGEIVHNGNPCVLEVFVMDADAESKEKKQSDKGKNKENKEDKLENKEEQL